MTRIPEHPALRAKLVAVAKATLAVITDATNFPVVDPGYREDGLNARAAERREIVDPANTAPVTRLRIPL